MKQLEEQIQWYEQNASRRDDDIIRANLGLIKTLYDEIQYSEDVIYFDKIIGTFCEIMDIQRDVIGDLQGALEAVPDPASSVSGAYSAVQNFIAAPPVAEFESDKQLREAFTAYCLEGGKSACTVSDYCSRIRKLWDAFCGECGDALSRELIQAGKPLLNAYRHTEELARYVEEKISAAPGDRNLANTRAAFRKFKAFRERMGN